MFDVGYVSGNAVSICDAHRLVSHHRTSAQCAALHAGLFQQAREAPQRSASFTHGMQLQHAIPERLLTASQASALLSGMPPGTFPARHRQQSATHPHTDSSLYTDAGICLLPHILRHYSPVQFATEAGSQQTSRGKCKLTQTLRCSATRASDIVAHSQGRHLISPVTLYLISYNVLCKAFSSSLISVTQQLKDASQCEQVFAQRCSWLPPKNGFVCGLGLH